MRHLLALLLAAFTAFPAHAAGPEAAPRFSAVVAQRYAGTLKILATKLPEDFKALTAQIDLIEKGGELDSAKHARTAGLVADLRKKYRYKIPYASEETQAALISQLANFFETVLTREGPMACSQFAINGTTVLVQNGVAAEYAALIDTQSALYFTAVASAFEKSDFHGEAGRADWKTVLDAMVSAGAPEEFVRVLGTVDPKEPARCPAMSVMFRTAANMDGAPAEKVRSNLAQNASGY